jgi:hypothetical protein
VGSIQPSSGKGASQPLAGVGFDTPTLLGSWAAKSYLHNGQKASVLDVIAGGHGNAAGLPAADRQALANYVRSLDTASEYTTRLRSSHSSLCVNIRGASAASGAVAIQWPCGTANNETFTVRNFSGGYVQLVAKHSNQCLAQDSTATSGAGVVQLACTVGNTAQWTLSGSTLRNRASGACLDVPNNSTAQDIPLLTWTCNAGNNQNWLQLP